MATGLAAAAHGGFTTVCLMPNTTPAIDDPAVVGAGPVRPPRRRVARAGADARRGHRRAGQGETLAPLGELADAGSWASPTTARRSGSASLLANALAYAGSLGLPVVDHPEDPSLTDGAEAAEGYVATVLGLRGWPVAGESAAVARAIAILADVVRDVPGARLHLTHVSTAASLAHVRAAKAAGLPVTCDVTPHHLALDRRVDRRLAPLGLGRRRRRRPRARPVGRRLDHGGAVRPVAARQPAAAPRRGRASRAWRRCGTAPRTPSPPTTPRTPRSTSTSSSAGRPTGSAASRPRSASCSRRWTRASCRSPARSRR